MSDSKTKLTNALWRIYNRPDRPHPWDSGGNLPWNDPDFSARMLREHLDDSHGTASRTTAERQQQIDWLWSKMRLRRGATLLDVTCGPGLYAVEFARRGCHVIGIDFGPAAIDYARRQAAENDVAGYCTFVEQDVREIDYAGSNFDAALFIYGQLAVFKREEAQMLLNRVAQSLKPGGQLCVELLNQDRVDKGNSNWWFTDDCGLWGETPFLHLGERFWYEEEKLSLERFQTIDLQTGELVEIQLCDQTYAVAEMVQMMQQAGFKAVAMYEAWDGLPLYDAGEWIVYLAQR